MTFYPLSVVFTILCSSGCDIEENWLQGTGFYTMTFQVISDLYKINNLAGTCRP